MNQNIKSFEEFKNIYTSKEFKEVLQESLKVKKIYKKFVIITLIWGIPAILLSLIFFPFALVVMLIGIVIEYFIFKDTKLLNYPTYFRVKIPYLIAKLSGIELKTTDVDEEKYFNYDEIKKKSKMQRFKDGLKGEEQKKYYKEQQSKIEEMQKLNEKQFKSSHIVDADKYITSNIAQFIHKETNTKIDFYHASAYDVKKRQYIVDGEERTETKYKLLTNGVVFSMENLDNIKLKDIRILIKDDDTLLSHITENTIDSIKENKNEIKFNRIDLNKSFDCFVYSKNKKQDVDVKVEALKILTPTLEDLLSYIRKKYGRFNLAINNNKIDIQLLDTKLIGGNKNNYKNIIIKPKVFSNNDLKISYLYRYYELIEIQKLILKYLNCYPEKYLITEEDVNGLREAIESNKLSDYEMDNSVKQFYETIF